MTATAAALVVAGTLLVTQAAGDNKGAETRATTKDTPAASDAPGYTSVRELVADSPVIAVGHITQIRRDEAPCPGIPAPDCTPWYVTFDIDEQLAGPPTKQLRILHYGYDEDPPQLHWGRVGDHAIQFLTNQIRNSYHRPQAMFTLTADGLIDPWGLQPHLEAALRGEPWTGARRHVEAEIAHTAMPDKPNSDDTGPPEQTPDVVEVTRCRDIPRTEPPQDHGVDNSFNPETNLIDIWYTVEGQNRHHTLDYVNDHSCGEHPLLKRLITHIVETHAESDVQEPPPPPPPWHQPAA